MKTCLSSFLLFCLFWVSSNAQGRDETKPLFFVRAKAVNSQERTQIANAGIAIDGVLSDAVTFFSTEKELKKLTSIGVSFEATPFNERSWGFPGSDEAFHDYQETSDALKEIAAKYPSIAQTFSIGKSVEGRELYGVRLSSARMQDSLPTMVLMGCHHAREHLSVEIPLLMAQHLSRHYGTDPKITKLLDTIEVWIVPMINPDGAEHDIHRGVYKMWRKNRRDNGDGTMGVDLNRNYGTGWGGPGSSSDTDSDIYRGPHAFSEPETLAVKEFLKDRKKTTTLISFHTFSELVLWPFGHTNDEVPNAADLAVFETIGKKMAKGNRYTPMKSSGLYLASGDTADWAYDELGIFAFTFELSPSSLFQGGFYPGAQAIEPTFKANLQPILDLMEVTDNPYRSVIRDDSDPLNMLH